MSIRCVISSAGSRARSERGAVFGWVALFMPVLVLFATLAIDVGNWFEHRRHLQTQADAAALAGGSAWGASECAPGSTTEQRIEAFARDYGGPHVGHTSSSTFNPAIYNAQVGGTQATNMHLLVNSLNYYNEGGSNYSDPDGSPCDAGFLDVKLTERDLPFFFPFSGSVVPAINARARVSILEAASVGGPPLLPVFVRDVNPNSAAVLFISENDDGTTSLLDAEYLTRLASCDSGFACWNNALNPASVTIARRTSAVVAVSNFPRCPVTSGNCMSLSGSANTICQQLGVECYWADAATGAVQGGVVYIRGYDATAGGGGPPNAPALRSVELVAPDSTIGSTCPNGYFAFSTTNCSVGLRAQIDVGTFNTADMQVAVFGGECNNNNGCPLTYTTGGWWQGAIPIRAAADPPTVPFRIRWTLRRTTLNAPYGACPTNFGGNNPCEAFFEGGTYVHRSFSASDQFAGPVRTASVVDANNPSANANSYPIGQNVSLIFGARLAGAVATSASDPPVQLRAVDTSQSAVDCEPNVTYRDEVTLGCNRNYARNSRLTAPDPCDPPYGQNQADLWSGVEPYDCVAVGPGASVGQFTDGIQGRVLNGRQPCTACPSACPLSNGTSYTPGQNYWASMFNEWIPGDPRIVVVFMVPFGAFRAQGRALFPITNFGAFYITGWGGNGGGNNDPCPGADPNVPTGWLSGHFIKYTLPSNSGGGTGTCVVSTTTPCVAVLTH